MHKLVLQCDAKLTFLKLVYNLSLKYVFSAFIQYWKYSSYSNKGKSVSFYYQVAVWVPDMFCNFYNVKKLIFAITQQPWKLEKNKHGFGILRNRVIFWMHVSLNLKTIKCYLVKLATNLYWQPSFWFHLINQGGFKANFLIEKCLKIIKRHCGLCLL